MIFFGYSCICRSFDVVDHLTVLAGCMLYVDDGIEFKIGFVFRILVTG